MAAPRKFKDTAEYRFDSGREAKEPNAIQRMHKRGWPIAVICRVMRCTAAAIHQALAEPIGGNR
ncbi:hypothetical protein [Prescottella equi]|uniref:hypothetical protein n=1 Tax=Rhodococcus hoagii TaxID=43767 RepID=UPI000A10A6EF|nr:hypothetical protein [Prescottella equi]ORM18327.1 hypothetical protein A5N74_12030 [Prescottella equi]